jgi:hypothetical protein
VTPLFNPAPPNLPLAPEEYASRYQEQFNNILRLYFRQISGSLQSISGVNGGQFLQFPYGAFQNNTDVVASAINTPNVILLNTTDYASGMFYVPGDGIHVEQSGIYNLQFSIQFRNTDTQAHNVFLWIRKNGVDLQGSSSSFTVPSKHGSGDGYLIGAANFYVDLMADGYVELWWATPNLAVTLDAIPVQTTPYPRPLTPSVVATLSFVSTV